MKKPTLTLQQTAALLAGAMAAGISAQASSDYGPAIWRAACSSHHYSSGYGHRFHVIHDMEGYYASTISMIQGCSGSVSVHYCANGKQDTSTDYPAGELTQMVSESEYAWHALCWNQYSTGCEHEGFASNPAWYTESMYQASAGLSRHEANKFGYLKDRNHIVGHNEHNNATWRAWASANLGIDPTCNTHTDPGSYWDWSHYMQLINGLNNTSVTSPSIITRGDGRIAAYVVMSPNGAPEYRQKNSTGGSFAAWVDTGGTSFDFVRATPIDNGGMAVFGMGSGNVYYKYLTTSNDTTWSGWVNLAGTGFNSVDPIMKTDGTMAVVGCGTGTTIYYKEQTATGPGAAWTGWTDLNASGFWEVDGVALPNGGVAIFGVGSGSSVYYKYKTTSAGSWSGWINLGGSGFSHISAVKETGGKLAFFGCGSTVGSPIYYQEQTAVGASASWSGWISLGGSGFSSISGVALPNNGLAVFGCGDGSPVYYQKRASATASWDGYTDLAGSGFYRVAATADAAGLMTVVGRGGLNGGLYEKHQTSSTAWSGYTDLGGTLE